MSRGPGRRAIRAPQFQAGEGRPGSLGCRTPSAWSWPGLVRRRPDGAADGRQVVHGLLLTQPRDLHVSGAGGAHSWSPRWLGTSPTGPLTQPVEDLQVEFVQHAGVCLFGESAPAGRRRATAKLMPQDRARPTSKERNDVVAVPHPRGARANQSRVARGDRRRTTARC
jgi:hypothetical protein